MLDLIAVRDLRTRRLADRLIRSFWPGPLTLVLKKSRLIPGIVTAGRATVAVRMPAHPAALKLIGACGVPLAAPSANRFGSISPTRASHVRHQLGNKVGMILDGGACNVGLESTILDLSGRKPVILRPGGVPAGKIEKILGIKIKESPRKDGRGGGLNPRDRGYRSPGRLKSHYAPVTPLHLVSRAELARLLNKARPHEGFVAMKRAGEGEKNPNYRCLSESGSMTEAAAGLYHALHDLDKLGLRTIYVERPDPEGVGRAMTDRLTRASHR